MGQIYLVRHGQASFGAADYDQLSTLGAEQAQMLGGWLSDCGLTFGRVVTGSLKRHRQTAENCLGALSPSRESQDDWETDAGFDEYDHDDVLLHSCPEFSEPGAIRRHIEQSARPQQMFRQIFTQAMQRWMGGAHDDDYRESWPMFRARCVGALERLTQSADGAGNIIVFTSGGTIATICQHLLAFPDHEVAKLTWTLVNSSATKLLHRGGHVTLSTLNNHAHLEKSGRPQTITYR